MTASKTQGPDDRPIWGALGTPQNAEGDEEGFHELEEAAPVTPSPHILSADHRRFCQEYIKDLNGSQSYHRTYPNANSDSCRSEAARLLAQPRIRAEIQALLDERAAITGITADRVLLKLWEAGIADPRELVEIRIGCCRHCWGLYHQYQHTDAELEKAEADFIKSEAKRRKAEKDDFQPGTFHGQGGGGFDRNRQPHPECPECGGDGQPRQIIKDSRNLSPGALRLFGGIKIDKGGNLSVIVRDPNELLVKVGQHLGLWSDKLPGPQNVNPMAALIEAIRGQSGTAGALPIVRDDPELANRPAPDVQDVEAKPATVSAFGVPPGHPKSSPRPKAGGWKAAK